MTKGSKSIFQSVTVGGGLIALLPLFAEYFGAAQAVVAQAAPVVSALLVLFGRLKADKRLRLF